VLRAFKYRLYPNRQQRLQLESVLDCCRKLYNGALAHKRLAWREHRIRVSCYNQINELPVIKRKLSEFNKVYSQVLQDVLRRLDKSFQKLFKEKTGILGLNPEIGIEVLFIHNLVFRYWRMVI